MLLFFLPADITQLDTSVEQLQKKNTDQSTTIQAQSESIADLEGNVVLKSHFSFYLHRELTTTRSLL